jgi:hypothetical protein
MMQSSQQIIVKGLQDESLPPATLIKPFCGVRAAATTDPMMPQFLAANDNTATDKTFGISCDVAVPVAGSAPDLLNVVIFGRHRLRLAASVTTVAIGQSLRCIAGEGVLATTGQQAIAIALHTATGGQLVDVFVFRHVAA